MLSHGKWSSKLVYKTRQGVNSPTFMMEVPPKPYHQHIPHESDDGEIIDPGEETVSFFEKQITSIHNLMRAKKQLPSFDSVRRAAEEVDGRFALKHFSDHIPPLLHNRLPAYGERRILAVETVLCELGYLSRAELRQGLDQANLDQANDDGTNTLASLQSARAASYAPEIDTGTYQEPHYGMGDTVQVVADAKPGHIRTPVYLFGKQGKIANVQGVFLNPEDLAHFKPRVLRLPLYLVEFDMAEVWGDRCPPRSLRDKIRVEIYEPWLMPLV